VHAHDAGKVARFQDEESSRVRLGSGRGTTPGRLLVPKHEEPSQRQVNADWYQPWGPPLT
jgi:hypothetical protein